MRITRVFFICLTIFVGVSGLTAWALSANTDIVINEIGAYPTSTHEWVEIWNKGPDPIDLSGWKFLEGGVKHGTKAQLTDSAVAPGEYAVIVQDDAQFLLDHPGFTGSVFDSSWGSLSETGEEIGIEDSNGAILEKFVFEPGPNFSLERTNPFLNDYSGANWKENLYGDTVGLINSYTHSSIGDGTVVTTTLDQVENTPTDTTTTTDQLKPPDTTADWANLRLNEIYPHPSEGQEWAEIFNTGSSTIDLAGGSICDGRANNCTIVFTSGTIPGESWKVFFLNSSLLNNTGDSVILKNPNGQEIDKTTYTEENAPGANQSLARLKDGSGEFFITLTPTPGYANNIVGETVAPNNVGSGGGGSGVIYDTVKSNPVTTLKNTAAKTITKKEEITFIWRLTTPPFAEAGTSTTFVAQGTADPRGGKIDFKWDFGDGTSAVGQAATHTYIASGTWAGRVYATSSAGTVGYANFSVNVYKPGEAPQIFLNEILPNPNGAETGEFIELYNGGQTEQDISGWILMAGSAKYIIPTSSTIPRGDYRVFYKTATKLTQANQGQLVALLTPNNNLVDKILVPKLAEGQSYNRVNNTWAASVSTTPGGGNIIAQVLGEKITTPKAATPKAKSNLRLLSGLAETADLPSNQPVLVSGTVVALPGTFNKQSMYLNDDSGSAEIYSYKGNFPKLVLGDKIKIIGVLGKNSNLPRIKITVPDNIQVHAHGTETFKPLGLSDLTEDLIGALVKVKGEITESKRGKFYVDDGTTDALVTLKPSTHILNAPKKGDRVEIKALVMRGQNGLELWPRNNDDIFVESKKDSLAASSTKQLAPAASHTFGFLTLSGSGLMAALWKWRNRLLKTPSA